MANFVHARETPEGLRYRVWNTVVDAYETEPLTREEVIDYLIARDLENLRKEAAERLTRADQWGTSSRVDVLDPRTLTDPWDAERCYTCGGWSREPCPKCPKET